MDNMTVRAWRLAKEITQEQMAECCEVHVNTYMAWEKEPEKIPIGKAVKIAERLGVSIDRIIFC